MFDIGSIVCVEKIDRCSDGMKKREKNRAGDDDLHPVRPRKDCVV